MPILSSPLRKGLSDAVIAARKAAEAATKATISGLGVTESTKPSHLSDEQAGLRRALRVKLRQFDGDVSVLVSECAFEQWHRLLFARFLAENGLLLHPDLQVAVTIDECEELAGELGEPDGWSVAARFASEILPGIFRLDDPCVRLPLAPEGREALERIVVDLSSEVFHADDALGWVYQYWQAEKKDEVNKSERRIGGADLGPVTQLFTENYMVRFLLENSLGAWWATRHPDSPLVKSFEYLRFDDNDEPAAGSFDGWPSTVAEVTVMDPSCGSGHFLVEAFSMLWQMRAEEEGLGPVAAQDAVLRDNLFGLELDPRCVQIAMLAVALHAWKAGGGWRQLPVPNVACSGIPIKAPMEEWKALADGDERLENALVRLHVLFRDADTLGSLIDPKRATEISDPTGLQQSFEDVDWHEVAPLLREATAHEAIDPGTAVVGGDAVGVARATDFLSRGYSLVVTNPPYLPRTKFGSTLLRCGDADFGDSKNELATMMLERSRRLAAEAGGVVAFVMPQTWLTLVRQKGLRERLLATETWLALARLGLEAFESISSGYVDVFLGLWQRGAPSDQSSVALIDAQTVHGRAQKAQHIRHGDLGFVLQEALRRNPDSRVLWEQLTEAPLLGEVGDSHQGIKTSDSPRFARQFWEFAASPPGWCRVQSSPNAAAGYTGRGLMVFWEDGHGRITEVCQEGATFRGRSAWNRRGVAISEMGYRYATLYTGEIFDGSVIVVTPNNDSDVAALWHFIRSPDFEEQLAIVNPKLSVSTSSVVQVPFDVERWRQVAGEAGPLPDPWSDDPTQWLFEGRPEGSTAPLQVAVARLLGYRWPDQAESDDLDVFADSDGIVCLPSVAGEAPAGDRVQQVLGAAFGEEWSPVKVKELLERSGSKKKTLADWLRDDFFAQHCKVFGNRPFIWHIWDGRNDGFSALVNYHRLDRSTLEKLTYSYLGQDWVERQRSGVENEEPGAEARLVAAQALQVKLAAILEGEPPFDVYVRWKRLDEQSIGWSPDLEDGVRLNIRPFVEAGVLRSKVSLHWNKDRGKNPDGGERVNDLNFTNAQKRAARAALGRS